MKKFDMTKVTRVFGKAGLSLKKHSPELLVVGGVIGGITATVMACKATTKLSAITDKAKNDLEAIHRVMKNPELVNEEYTVEDGKKDLTIVYAHTALDIAKLYGPAALVGGLSITAILTGHNIMRKRNFALAATCTAVEQAFGEYRGRVVERFGEELDRELRYNIKAKEIEEVIVNEDGTETTVKKTVNVAELDGYSIFARFFDDGCTGWDKNPEYSLMFLKQQQKEANRKLKRQGYLFINDVYDMLGIPKTIEGQTHGWIYDEKNPVGDNQIDFGIYDYHRTKNRDFVNGFERVILLDFNHDGNIMDKIW